MTKYALATQSMIATGNPLAAHCAQRILAAGGNAIDAAIAADIVMGVVEPMATGIGGDMLAMVVPVGTPVQSYNGSGRAPLALNTDDVARLPGGRIPERHPLSLTTPGLVRGWHDLHQQYGQLDWPLLFKDAIQLCFDGFPVYPIVASEWKVFDHVLHADPGCTRMYHGGTPPVAGERFYNPPLGHTLTQIQHEGWQPFYHGDMARHIEHAAQRMGGVLTAQDLATHQGNYCEPASADMGDVRLYQCPPNTHGIAVLNALSSLDLDACQQESPESVLQMLRATERAMTHASATVCDPAGNTVCTVIVDKDGLAVTLMSSIFKRFGSGIAVPEGGFVLQNRGHGFSEPGHINGAAPGRRPYHTVVPGAATRQGDFFMGMGVVGGLMQPQGQIQILTRNLIWEQSIEHAVQAPRWRLEGPGKLAIEDDMPADITAALRAAGYHKPDPKTGELAGRSDFGGAQAVRRNHNGELEGVSDKRKDGIALGMNF